MDVKNPVNDETMTRCTDWKTMRTARLLLLVLALPGFAQELAGDIAAAHKDGKWQIRKADLYQHLAAYYSNLPVAKTVLPDYLRRRLIEDRATKGGITVTDADIAAWVKKIDDQIRARTGGTGSLDQYRKDKGMTLGEFKRRVRLAILRERVARADVNKRDPSRDKQKPLDDSTVGLVIDEMYRKAPKVLDPKKLKSGLVARIDGIDITAYQYGRELSYALPRGTVARALSDLILVEEVNLLLGNDDPPTEAQLAAQKKWMLTMETNRLQALARAQRMKGQPVPKVTETMVRDIMKQRGMPLEKALENPASRAQARARGYFRALYDVDAHELGSEAAKKAEAELKKYYDAHKEQFGDQLKVQRLLIAARAQRVGNVGQKIRTLQQGKAVADAVHKRITGGADFGEVARQMSDDIPVIKNTGGFVPFLVRANSPGYQDTWRQANSLKEGQVSKPFFSAGRGFVIVKLVERQRAFGLDSQREAILTQASEQAYRRWRNASIQTSIRAKDLLDKKR